MTQTQTKFSTVIVYHDQCIDGLGSAWVLNRHLSDPDTMYIPYAHGHVIEAEKILTALPTAENLYFVDVAPRPDFLNDLIARKNIGHIYIYDHHISAATALDGFTNDHVTIHISPDNPSATKMIWDHFLKTTPPDFVTMIDKIDRGEGMMDDTDFAAASYIDAQDISTTEQGFAAIEKLSSMTQSDMADLGHDIFKSQQQKIDTLFQDITFTTVAPIPDHPPVVIPMVQGNIRDFGRKISARLVTLAQDHNAPLAVIWDNKPDGSGVTLSLRSNGTIDASQTAQFWGETYGGCGGGHTTAAGVDLPSFPF